MIHRSVKLFNVSISVIIPFTALTMKCSEEVIESGAVIGSEQELITKVDEDLCLTYSNDVNLFKVLIEEVKHQYDLMKTKIALPKNPQVFRFTNMLCPNLLELFWTKIGRGEEGRASY